MPVDGDSGPLSPRDLGLGLLFERVREAVVVADVDTGRISLWNPAAVDLLGFNAAEAIGQPLELIIPERFRPMHRQGWEHYRRQGVGRLIDSRHPVEVAALRADGSEVPIELTLSPLGELPTGGRYVLALLRDVTERKRETEARLAALQADVARAEAERGIKWLQQVIDLLPEGVIVVDRTGQVILASRIARETLGELAPPLNLIGPGAPVITWRLDGTPYPSDEIPLARSLHRGEVVRGEQLLIRHAVLAREIPVLVNSSPLRDETDAIVGGIVAFQDITAIKELEQEKNALVAAITHDLKTPLTAIRGNAQILKRLLDRRGVPDVERLRRGLSTIDATAVTMAEMIDDLGEASRADSGAAPALQRRATDLVALVLRVATQYQAISEQHRIRVETGVPQLVGYWDPVRLERALANLVSNAIKYSPKGGEVTIAVNLVTEPEGPHAVVAVTDQGIGIPAEDLPSIFDRHHRGRNVAGIVGTGIGLWAARQIAEQHRGTIEVRSVEGQGTTFTVSVPLT